MSDWMEFRIWNMLRASSQSSFSMQMTAWSTLHSEWCVLQRIWVHVGEGVVQARFWARFSMFQYVSIPNILKNRRKYGIVRPSSVRCYRGKCGLFSPTCVRSYHGSMALWDHHLWGDHNDRLLTLPSPVIHLLPETSAVWRKWNFQSRKTEIFSPFVQSLFQVHQVRRNFCDKKFFKICQTQY